MQERLSLWLQRALGPLSFLTTRDVGMLGAGALSALAAAKYCEACRKV